MTISLAAPFSNPPGVAFAAGTSVPADFLFLIGLAAPMNCGHKKKPALARGLER